MSSSALPDPPSPTPSSSSAPPKTTVPLRTLQTSTSSDALRPCQKAYLGETTTRRLLRRAQLTKTPGTTTNTLTDPIFAAHHQATTTPHPTALAASLTTATILPFTNTTPGYTVECYATHTEDAARAKAAQATEKEKLVLLTSLNASRAAESQPPLQLSPTLSKLAQTRADLPDPNPASVTVVMSPTGTRVARLVSPPRMGALACGEMWYGGKYKRHLYSLPPGREGERHREDCPCRLRMCFEAVTDAGWGFVGIGRGEGDGRWVVELME